MQYYCRGSKVSESLAKTPASGPQVAEAYLPSDNDRQTCCSNFQLCLQPMILSRKEFRRRIEDETLARGFHCRFAYAPLISSTIKWMNSAPPSMCLAAVYISAFSGALITAASENSSLFPSATSSLMPA